MTDEKWLRSANHKSGPAPAPTGPGHDEKEPLTSSSHPRSYAVSPSLTNVRTVDAFRRPPIEQPVFLTKLQLANRLGVTTRTIDRWTLRGLPFRQVVGRRRYQYEEVLEWTETAGVETL